MSFLSVQSQQDKRVLLERISLMWKVWKNMEQKMTNHKNKFKSFSVHWFPFVKIQFWSPFSCNEYLPLSKDEEAIGDKSTLMKSWPSVGRESNGLINSHEVCARALRRKNNVKSTFVRISAEGLPAFFKIESSDYLIISKSCSDS